jgi:ectoine hydroxylase-related dioxygenase (phytanoyl-CoA dioxygenase family)
MGALAESNATSDPAWLETATAELSVKGFAVIRRMLTPERVETYKASVFRVREKTIAAIGRKCFEQSIAAGYTELRLPFLFEPVLFDLLADPKVLALVDAVLGPTAILRFLNALITPPETAGATARHTGSFHQNFKVPLNASQGPAIFMELALPLTTPAQSFRIAPTSQKLPGIPSEDYLDANAVDLDWECGDGMLMTPFVWHREQQNMSDLPAASIFMQFSRPFIKPHADYLRALDSATLAQLPERTRQFLGSHSQLPTSISDYYLPADQRPYRPGQW